MIQYVTKKLGTVAQSFNVLGKTNSYIMLQKSYKKVIDFFVKLICVRQD